MKKAYVFIDSANIWQAQKSKRYLLDFEKLVEYLKKQLKGHKIKVFYYAAYPKEGTRGYDTGGKHKFFTMLHKKLGITVRKKPLKQIRDTISNKTIEKGNMDVELTMDAVNFMDSYDTAVFFTGDSDFLSLISYMRKHEKKVFIFSSKNNISDELRTGADGYTDILSLEAALWRKPVERKK